MATKTKTKKTQAEAARAGLLEAEKQIGQAVMEREEPIRGLLLALLTRQHLLLLGPPGTAKSMLTDLFQETLQCSERFRLLLTKTTLPDELFGMWDIGKVSKGLMERIDCGGTMRSAQIAFLDEVFKANSTTLNSLLGALNERVFRNGTQGLVDLPLISCVGASNEYPQGDDLGALYDRFALRYWIGYLGEESNWTKLLLIGGGANPTTSISLAQLEAAQADVAKVGIPQSIGPVLLEIRNRLGSVGIRVSDRRWVQAMKLLRAQAWLEGRTDVEKADLLVLQNVLWDNYQEEGRKVADILLEVCAPKLKELLASMDLAHEQLRSLKQLSRSDSATRGEIREAKVKFEEVRYTVEQLAPDAGSRGHAELTRLLAMADEASTLHAGSVW